MTIPEIEEQIHNLNEQVAKMASAFQEVNENIQELRAQLGVERPPQPAPVNYASPLAKAVDRRY